MAVLGLNHGEINSSAALVENGVILAGAPEERFSREKRTRLFPTQAARYCLSSAGFELADLDAVAQGWNPGAHWSAYNPLVSAHRVRREDYLYTVPDNLLNLGRRSAVPWIGMSYPTDSPLPATYFINHHLCHASTAFFTSQFEEAAVFTADFRGETTCGMFGVGRGERLQTLVDLKLPNSLGMLYATFTQLLGYLPDSDEWKVMALSSFPVDASKEISALWSAVQLTDNGWFELDQSYFQGLLFGQPTLYSKKLVDLLGGRVGVPGEEPDEWHFRVAKAMQSVAEHIVMHALRKLHDLTGLTKVTLGGGFFMNSVINGRVASLTPFNDVFVPFAPGDVGNSIGAALFTEHVILGRQRSMRKSSSQIGPQFTDDEIVAALVRRGISYDFLANRPYGIASLLAENSLVAVFDGPMEFGERALGNRSILADPRVPDIKDQINASIKYREAYRPFAPVTTTEAAHLYFDVAPGQEVPFMEKVVPVRPEFRSRLAAITHIDGSGRLQTVSRNDNPDFHDLLVAFEKLSGVPVLLNTSFNVNGEPIVCSPDDALTTFFNSGLQFLVMGNFVIRKNS